jgi:2-polyprenyl-6-hydroxyphenyl methylase / 3-demethylubiquinone-9 3-methyltransferase
MSHNIDPEEIKKFDEFAKTWWDPNGSMSPLHGLTPIRIDYLNQHASITNQKILDIGCGGGILSEKMAALGGMVTGIDMSEKVLRVAKDHAEKNNINCDYQQSTAEAFAKEHANTFDIITCLEMLEHVPEPSAIIQACQQMLKPGGTLFFSTINRNPKSYLMAIVGAEYVLNILPRGTHEYSKFIKPSELVNWCQDHSLRLVDLLGLHYNPFSKHFSTNNNVDVNYLCCFRHDK